MSLHPETLGTIVVTVSRVGDTVSIQITASREALTQISSDAIHDAVTGKGFSVGKVEMQVLTPDASSTRSDNSDSSGSQRDRERGRESGPQERRDGTMRWDAEESEDPE